MIQRKDKYIVKADLPGLSMKDVSVEVDEKNRILHVTAKREHRAEEQDETVDKGAKWVAYERFYGKMDRSFGLPEDAVAEKDAINCRLVNGELTVSITRNPPQEEEAEKQAPRTKIPIMDH